MTNAAHFRLLATYNEWMNNKLYDAAATLPAGALSEQRGAFFGSLEGTLNHLVVADTIWLKRFAGHPHFAERLAALNEVAMPASLDQPLASGLAALRARRQQLDRLLLDWTACLHDDDLALVIAYRNTKGVAFRRALDGLLLHFFNHQTHHRGQASTLLFQAGVDVGVTDLLTLLPDA
jgi:uncharacterized damage-inducible protein DinB